MVTINNGSEPIFLDREVVLKEIRHDDSASRNEALDVEMQLCQAPLFLGGIPTDPDYCGTVTSGTGRRVTIQAIVGDMLAAEKTVCVASQCPAFQTGEGWDLNFEIQVPIPDELEPGETNLHIYFTTGDTNDNQFLESFEGGPESTVISSVTVEDEPPDVDLPEPGGDGEWEEVTPGETPEVGDTLRTAYCVHAPDVPFADLVAKFQTPSNEEIETQVNNELGCMTVQVSDTQLVESQGVVVDGNECEFLYVVTMDVTEVQENCEDDDELQYATIPQVVIVALAAVLVLAGISVVLWRTERLLSGDSGETIDSWGVLPFALAGGALYVYSREQDDD